MDTIKLKSLQNKCKNCGKTIIMQEILDGYITICESCSIKALHPCEICQSEEHTEDNCPYQPDNTEDYGNKYPAT